MAAVVVPLVSESTRVSTTRDWTLMPPVEMTQVFVLTHERIGGADPTTRDVSPLIVLNVGP